jgi:hypothetical protein
VYRKVAINISKPPPRVKIVNPRSEVNRLKIGKANSERAQIIQFSRCYLTVFLQYKQWVKTKSA